MTEGARRTVALIGGSGFVGTRLARRVAHAGMDFLIADKRDPALETVSFCRLDVTDPASLQRLPSVETIVNLAAEHRDDVRPVSRYQETNVDGARNICEFAEQRGVRQIVFTSSVAVYGFAPEGTDESGEIAYFNEYGRTKFEAEGVYRDWQGRAAEDRSLVIVRPTVIFGEGNRGNVYNLLRQIASRRFVMIGPGTNRKSMAYVENVAAFLEHALRFGAGVATYNYVDGPDFDMNTLVETSRECLFGKRDVGMRIPKPLGYAAGYVADAITRISGKTLPLSSIRIRKFLGTTSFRSSLPADFPRPVPLSEGLKRTITYEFLEDHADEPVFETE